MPLIKVKMWLCHQPGCTPPLDCKYRQPRDTIRNIQYFIRASWLNTGPRGPNTNQTSQSNSFPTGQFLPFLLLLPSFSCVELLPPLNVRIPANRVVASSLETRLHSTFTCRLIEKMFRWRLSEAVLAVHSPLSRVSSLIKHVLSYSPNCNAVTDVRFKARRKRALYCGGKHQRTLVGKPSSDNTDYREDGRLQPTLGSVHLSRRLTAFFFYGNDSSSDYSMNNKKENLNVTKGHRRGGASILGVYREWEGGLVPAGWFTSNEPREVSEPQRLPAIQTAHIDIKRTLKV